LEPFIQVPQAKFFARVLSIEIARVAERAAVAAAVYRGLRSPDLAVNAATKAILRELGKLPIEGTIVSSGEGERDGIPTRMEGKSIGRQEGGFKVDVALDPLDGRSLCADNMPGAVTVLAISEKGTLLRAPDVYMDKIAIGPGHEEGVVDLRYTAVENIERFARAKGGKPKDITVLVLKRPRNDKIVEAVKTTGARVRLLQDGDVIGAMQVAQPDATGVDIYMGIGGAPEGVLAAAALYCMGGQFIGRYAPSASQLDRVERLDVNRIFRTKDFVRGDCHFAATGVTDGTLLRGVRFRKPFIETETIVMRSLTGSVRRITTEHRELGKFDLPPEFEADFSISV